jgi:hypothetical protein
MIGQRPTYWSKSSHRFEGRAWWFWAHRWWFACYFDWQCYIILLYDSPTASKYWVLWNRVAGIQASYLMRATHHGAGSRFIQEQLGCKWPHSAWQSHERDQDSRKNDRNVIGKSQRLQNTGNATINKGSAIWPCLAKTDDKVQIAWYFERSETDLHIAEDACGIDYADTWSSKLVD